MHSDKKITLKNSTEIAKPAGHYSHVCIANGLVYISGQLPLTVDGTPLTGKPFHEQAAQVLRNVEGCLAGAGADKNSLVQVRVYVTDIKTWPLFNEIYATWIGEHRPARAVAGVSELHYNLTVEVEAIALAPQ
jgi:2-iminobutanoate/2-iminopropanoate deaminase